MLNRPEQQDKKDLERAGWGGGAGERHSELTLALVAGFHHCSVACRRTAAAPGPYDLFQLCSSQHHQPGLRDDPATGQKHLLGHSNLTKKCCFVSL